MDIQWRKTYKGYTAHKPDGQCFAEMTQTTIGWRWSFYSNGVEYKKGYWRGHWVALQFHIEDYIRRGDETIGRDKSGPKKKSAIEVRRMKTAPGEAYVDGLEPTDTLDAVLRYADNLPKERRELFHEILREVCEIARGMK